MTPDTATSLPGDDPVTMAAPDAKAKGARKPKGKAATEAKGKRSLNLSLPHEDYQRLAVHALDEGKTISDLVCELARTHLRRVHLARTPSRTGADMA
jgi:hypothetical protein